MNMTNIPSILPEHVGRFIALEKYQTRYVDCLLNCFSIDTDMSERSAHDAPTGVSYRRSS